MKNVLSFKKNRLIESLGIRYNASDRKVLVATATYSHVSETSISYSVLTGFLSRFDQ